MFSALIIAAGCDSLGDLVSPGPNNRPLRMMQRSFADRFPTSWPFDHDLPLGVYRDGDPREPGSDDVLTWRGETVPMWWGNGRHHHGYDWVMPEGTPLLAGADGEIVLAGPETPIVCGSKGEVAALIVSIRHRTSIAGAFESLYGHLSRVDVTVGSNVRAGQQIGLSGNTGCLSGPHLHFAVYRHTRDGRRVVVDPFGWGGRLPGPMGDSQRSTELVAVEEGRGSGRGPFLLIWSWVPASRAPLPPMWTTDSSSGHPREPTRNAGFTRLST